MEKLVLPILKGARRLFSTRCVEKSRRAPLAIFFWLLLVATVAGANELARPEVFARLVNQKQDHFAVPGSSVAWADYHAIRRDFPALQNWHEDAIDSWIIENFARMSESELLLRGLRIDHHEVGSNNVRRHAHPPNYHRASVAEVVIDEKNVGIIDLKGTGLGRMHVAQSQVEAFATANQQFHGAQLVDAINALRTRDHSDGMMSFGEAIAEALRQQALQMEFDLHNNATGDWAQTVESYFIIALPFRILKENGKSDPAAIYGRQAHLRGAIRENWLPEIFSDDRGGKQTSISGAVVDYGGTFLEDPRLFPTFGVPNESLRMTEKYGERKDPQVAKFWADSHQTADAYVRDVAHNPRAARRFVSDHFSRMLAPLDEPMREMRMHSRVLSVNEQRRRYLETTIAQAQTVSVFITNPSLLEERFQKLFLLLPHALRAEMLDRWAHGPKQDFKEELGPSLKAALALAQLEEEVRVDSPQFDSVERERQIARLEGFAQALPHHDSLYKDIVLAAEWARSGVKTCEVLFNGPPKSPVRARP